MGASQGCRCCANVSEQLASNDEAKDRNPTGFYVIMHRANLCRTFAKIGHMDPYAVLSVGGKEVFRTKVHSRGHKDPIWNENYNSVNVPDSLNIAVWDKNTLHKDVYCGGVSIPCTKEMPRLVETDFGLEKRARPTGSICLSLFVEFEFDQRQPASNEEVTAGPLMGRRNSEINEAQTGGEFTGIFDHLRGKMMMRRHLRLRRHGSTVSATASDASDFDDHDADADEDDKLPRMISKPVQNFQAHALLGLWICTATHGLEEFMVKSKVGVFQRKIALAARWPSWQFAAEGPKIAFVNHSAIGDIREDIVLNEEYDWKDGKQNAWKCLATWTDSPDGGSLLISREGPLGNYTEERRVNGDTLEFVLKNPTFESEWGRSFQKDRGA